MVFKAETAKVENENMDMIEMLSATDPASDLSCCSEALPSHPTTSTADERLRRCLTAVREEFWAVTKSTRER
jgi:hypothetical protein